MESATIDSMCRCCAAEGIFKDIKTSYHWMGEEEVYGDMLRECFDVKLSSVEEGGICEVCITQLRNAANFKKQVLHTEKKFKRHLETRQFKPTEVKEEVSGDNGNSSDDDHGADDSEDDEDYVPDFGVPIKTESPEESKSRKRTAKATTSRAKKSRVDDEKSYKEDEMKNIQKTSKSYREELIKQRHNLKQILLLTNATPIRQHTDLGYICGFCPKYFTKATDLKKHTLSHDRAYTSYMGKTCLSKFIVKLDTTNLECKICDEKIEFSETIDHLTGHEQLMHTDIDNYIVPFQFDDILHKCVLCSEIHRSFKALQIHMYGHYRNFVCEECGAGFVNQQMVYSHYVNSHKVGSFTCCQCKETFSTLKDKKRHEYHTHHNIKYKCGFCGKKFKSFELKQLHQTKVHNVRVPLFDCSACDKVFSKPSMLSIHIRKDHLMEKRYKCSNCPRAYFYKYRLAEHIVTHTHVKNFNCEFCDKRFSRIKSLQEHIKIHIGDRRFRCKICDEMFVQKVSLKKHLLSKHNAVLDY